MQALSCLAGSSACSSSGGEGRGSQTRDERACPLRDERLRDHVRIPGREVSYSARAAGPDEVSASARVPGQDPAEREARKVVAGDQAHVVAAAAAAEGTHQRPK